MRLVRTAFRRLAPPSWPGKNRGVPAAQPHYVERETWTNRRRFRGGASERGFCLELRHRALSAFAGEKACLTHSYFHPSTYVQTYQLGHITHHLYLSVSFFYHCCACSARKLKMRLIIPGIVSNSCPMSDMPLCVVLFMLDHTHSGSSIHPSLPSPLIICWDLQMARSNRVSRVLAGHSHANYKRPTTSAPITSTSVISPCRGRSMELTVPIRIHIQGVLGLSCSTHPRFGARWAQPHSTLLRARLAH